MECSELRRAVDRHLQTLGAARTRVRAEKRALKELRAKRAALEAAQQLAQGVAQQIQNKAHARIAEIVTSCIQSVFEDDPYTFHIIFERKRGRTEARLVFKRQGREVDPLTASGGGVVNVAAFALRVAGLVLSQPRARRLLVLDEPFRFVNVARRPKVRALLDALAERLGVQLVVVTHDPQFHAGRVVELS